MIGNTVEWLVELGTNPQIDPKHNKITRLINKICMLGILIIFTYMLLTLFFAALVAVLVQLITILALGFVIFLNSRLYFNLARALTLVTGNLHIFTMVLLLGLDRGVYFYFASIIIVPLFFYTRQEIRYIIFFVTLTPFLTLMVHLLGSEYGPILEAPTLLMTSLFYVSIVGSHILVFVFVFHFYSESHRFEKSFTEANNKLLKLSETDPLTQLPNRRSFNKDFEREWGKGIRNGNPCAMIMMDLDYFKRFNDSYGHQAGDRCLMMVAEIIAKHTRQYLDFPARFGGEEFIIFLSNTSLKEASAIADRIHGEILKLTIPDPNTQNSLFVTCSLGVASCSTNKKSDPQDLILQADQALYRAKKKGRNRIERSSYVML
jgi:diguanylate cyclase (GGDEF)-like protein